jgi:diguanylate cyclase (GGDEF)-like protein
MFGNGRKTIGVFITQIHQEFQETLSRGISKRAAELGYNVAFFSNFLGHGEFQYEIGERGITFLPRYQELDGIIILPDTMFVQGFDASIREQLAQYASCPVVSVRKRTDPYYNVLIDDSSVLDEIIRHFIVDHGYKRIHFLTGPRNNPASIQRLDSFRRIMKEYRLPVEEEQIYYGDFWKYMGYDAVRYWLSDPRKRPQAIICANDYMATTVCKALSERGICVPEDIAVSGCDNIAITEVYTPSITTAGMPVFEMGVEAVDKIDRHVKQIAQEKDTLLRTVTYWRESCGCKPKGNRETFALRRSRMISELEAKDKAISNNAFMSIELTNVKTIEELDRKLASYTYMNDGFISFYMCLHKDWELFGVEDHTGITQSDEMVMEVGIRNGEWLPRTEYSRPKLLPSCYVGSEPQIFLFNMLHYQEICYGYTAISFYGGEVYQSSYQGWLINVCNALENIRIHNVLKRLVSRLEDMSIKDELTDLYNRRALEQLGKPYLLQCIKRKTKLMVFSADMDKLKFINDNFGHAYGDIAIRTVADALRYAAEDDEICIRVSGDEFVVIGMDYDQEKIEEFTRRFENKLNQVNQDSNRGFQVYVSYGWCIIKPEADTTIEDCLLVSDARMYQLKTRKDQEQKQLWEAAVPEELAVLEEMAVLEKSTVSEEASAPEEAVKSEEVEISERWVIAGETVST